jgi:hypothetical protein
MSEPKFTDMFPETSHDVFMRKLDNAIVDRCYADDDFYERVAPYMEETLTASTMFQWKRAQFKIWQIFAETLRDDWRNPLNLP